MAGRKKKASESELVNPPKRPERLRVVPSPSSARSPKATPPRQAPRLAPAVAQSPSDHLFSPDLQSPLTPCPRPVSFEGVEAKFQQCLDGLDPSLETLGPALSLLFVTVVTALTSLQSMRRLEQTPASDAKKLGRDLRAHARRSLGSVIKSGFFVRNQKKHSRFAKAVRTVKRAAWQRACVDGWIEDNGVDSSMHDALHGVMRSYSNNVDQTAGDRCVFGVVATPTNAAHVF